jgi:hypothetical protein
VDHRADGNPGPAQQVRARPAAGQSPDARREEPRRGVPDHATACLPSGDRPAVGRSCPAARPAVGRSRPAARPAASRKHPVAEADRPDAASLGRAGQRWAPTAGKRHPPA